MPLSSRDKNGLCKRLSGGILPWGVCYYDYRPDEDPMNPSLVPPSIARIGFSTFILDICELGKFGTKIIRVDLINWLHIVCIVTGEGSTCDEFPSEFYCCLVYYPRTPRGYKTSYRPLYASASSTGEGFDCVPLSMLQGHTWSIRPFTQGGVIKRWAFTQSRQSRDGCRFFVLFGFLAIKTGRACQALNHVIEKTLSPHNLYIRRASSHRGYQSRSSTRRFFSLTSRHEHQPNDFSPLQWVILKV